MSVFGETSGAAWWAAPQEVQQFVPDQTFLSQIRVYVTPGPLPAGAVTFTLQVALPNGPGGLPDPPVDTNLSCSIDGGGPSPSNRICTSTGGVSIPGGSLVDLRVDTSTATTAQQRVAYMFTTP